MFELTVFAYERAMSPWAPNAVAYTPARMSQTSETEIFRACDCEMWGAGGSQSPIHKGSQQQGVLPPALGSTETRARQRCVSPRRQRGLGRARLRTRHRCLRHSRARCGLGASLRRWEKGGPRRSRDPLEVPSSVAAWNRSSGRWDSEVFTLNSGTRRPLGKAWTGALRSAWRDLGEGTHPLGASGRRKVEPTLTAPGVRN